MANPSTRSYVGVTTVTTAGTRIQISTGKRRVVRAYFRTAGGITGRMYVGGSDVSATVGIPVYPPTAALVETSLVLDFLPGTESEDFFWADAATSGDKLAWWFVFKE